MFPFILNVIWSCWIYSFLFWHQTESQLFFPNESNIVNTIVFRLLVSETKNVYEEKIWNREKTSCHKRRVATFKLKMCHFTQKKILVETRRFLRKENVLRWSSSIPHLEVLKLLNFSPRKFFTLEKKKNLHPWKNKNPSLSKFFTSRVNEFLTSNSWFFTSKILHPRKKKFFTLEIFHLEGEWILQFNAPKSWSSSILHLEEVLR